MKIFLFVLITSYGLSVKGQADTISRIDENLLNSVVNIQKGFFTGTGFIVWRKNPNGYQFFLVTNKHMLGDYNFVDPFIIDSSIVVSLYTTDTSKRHIPIKILLKDSSANILKTVKVHPLHTVDIAVIDITANLKKIPNWRIAGVDTSFLILLKDISEATGLSLGSQIFTIGYPAGLKLESSNQPIAKVCYVASSLNGTLKVRTQIVDKKKKAISVVPDGRYFLVDGLIIGGNSGGPIINPQGVRTKMIGNDIYYSNKSIPNLFIGIVSSGFGNTGITIVYSCDNIREIIDKFPTNY